MVSSAAVTSIRNSRKEDLAELKEFAKQMYIEDAAAHGGTSPDMELTFKELTKHPEKGRLLAIEYDGKLAGYAIIIFFWSNEYHGNVIDIDEVFIAAPYRSKGLATKFFDWLGETFKDDSVGWSLQVSKTNDRARALYERLGFTMTRNHHMFKMFGQ